MKVKVTQEHIYEANHPSCGLCPVELALAAVGIEGCWVSSKGIIEIPTNWPIQINGFPKPIMKHYVIPEVQKFVPLYDTGSIYALPFEFEIELEKDDD